MMQNDLMEYFNMPDNLLGSIGQQSQPQQSGFDTMGTYGGTAIGSLFSGDQRSQNPGLGSVGNWQGAGSTQHNIWDMGDGAYMQNPFYGRGGAGSSISSQGSATPSPNMTGRVGSGVPVGGQGGMQRAAGQGGLSSFGSMQGYGSY